MSQHQRAKMDAACAFEQKGQHQAAAQIFIELDRPLDAVRNLALSGDYAAAGRLLRQQLGVDVALASTLQADKKQHAELAASYLEHAGQWVEAAQLRQGLGQKDRAASLFKQAQNLNKAQPAHPSPTDASITRVAMAFRQSSATSRGTTPLVLAQRAERQGDFGRALTLYVEMNDLEKAFNLARRVALHAQLIELLVAQRHDYEAAQILIATGNQRGGLECLMRLTPSDKNYRAAALQAIALLEPVRYTNDSIDAFVSPFLLSPSLIEEDQRAWLQMARIYSAQDRNDEALQLCSRVLSNSPDHEEALDLQDAITRNTPVAVAVSPLGQEPRRSTISDVFTLTPEPSALQVATTPPADSSPPSSGSSPSTPSSPSWVSRASLTEGFVVGDRYRLEEKLGAGGMAVVYKAQDLELDEQIAIKFFNLSEDSEDQIARFKRETSLTRRLAHPNIVRVYDLGLHDDLRFLTMELLEGEDLAHRLRREISIAESVDILLQACAGIEVAHQQGIVHRDIKPDNLF